MLVFHTWRGGRDGGSVGEEEERRRVNALLSCRVEKRPRPKEIVQREGSLLLVFHTCKKRK